MEPNPKWFNVVTFPIVSGKVFVPFGLIVTITNVRKNSFKVIAYTNPKPNSRNCRTVFKVNKTVVLDNGANL